MFGGERQLGLWTLSGQTGYSRSSEDRTPGAGMNTYAKPRRRGGGLLRVIIVLIVLVVIAWMAAMLFPGGGGDPAAKAAESTPDQLKQGEYLARLGDCAACHTAPGGKPYAGGLAIASPIGTITPGSNTSFGPLKHVKAGQIGRAHV